MDYRSKPFEGLSRMTAEQFPKKLVWRKLNVKVPPSKVIIGGVDSIHVDSEL